MKKFTAVAAAVMAVAMFVSCTDTGSNNSSSSGITDWTEKEMLTVDEILETTSASRLKCDKYSLSKYMKEVWASQIIYNETAMFFRDENGTVGDKTMLFDIAKVLEVRNNTLEILYEEGKDYTVVDGKLRWLDGSDIFVMDYNDFWLDAPNDPNAAFSSESHPGKYYYYTEGSYFASKQVSVTYIRTEKWNGPEIPYDETKLPKTREKLKNKENINIVYYGDSIMEGCNSSNFTHTEPFMPMLSTLITRRLSSYFDYDGTTSITEINTAVGGWATTQGVEYLDEKVIAHSPDLVVLKFGGNDGTWGLPAQTYGNNLKNMMDRVRAVNPDAEFILISGCRANPDARNKEGRLLAGDLDSYTPVLKGLSEEEGVAFADMFTLSKYILGRKDYIDITGNNVSHPTDFLIRVEAQLVCSILIPVE